MSMKRCAKARNAPTWLRPKLWSVYAWRWGCDERRSASVPSGKGRHTVLDWRRGLVAPADRRDQASHRGRGIAGALCHEGLSRDANLKGDAGRRHLDTPE